MKLLKLPLTVTNHAIVSCNGGERQAFGHPLIYLNLESTDEKMCPYCRQVFVYRTESLSDSTAF